MQPQQQQQYYIQQQQQQQGNFALPKGLLNPQQQNQNINNQHVKYGQQQQQQQQPQNQQAQQLQNSPPQQQQQQQLGGIKTFANTAAGPLPNQQRMPPPIQQQQKNTNTLSINNNNSAGNNNNNSNNISTQNQSQNTQVSQFSLSREQSGQQPMFQSQNSNQQENEKLKLKLQNMDQIIQMAQGFEKTQNVMDLKKFAQLNQQKFTEMIDELFDCKIKLEEEKKRNQELEQKVNSSNSQLNVKSFVGKDDNSNKDQVNQELQKQIQTLQQEKDKLENKLNNQEEFTDRDQMIEQIKNQHETIQELSGEVNELSSKNQEYFKCLKKKDFFQEYENNLREVDGLRKENRKVMEDLKNKRDEIAILQGKQPPSQAQSNLLASMNISKNF